MASVPSPELLVHLCAPSVWRMGLAAGTLSPHSLMHEGFVHLSTVEQVALPANALYAGRTDLVALVVDPARLPGEVRWEPGRPDDPASMRFPHHYGPLPAAAVVAAVPYRPGADGQFTAPVGLPAPLDVDGRVKAFDRALAERRAAAVVPVTGGVAVVDPRFPASHEHNTLWIAGPVDAATIEADAERVLSGPGLSYRRAVVDDADTAAALATRRWEVQELRLMRFAAPAVWRRGDDVAVVPVAHEVVARLWRSAWRREIPGIDDATLAQLVDREPLADAVMRVVDLAVLSGAGEPVASAQLRIDGATAAIEAVMTDPSYRGAGRARALVVDAIDRARAAGCDVVLLTADANDWPREWYARLGFVDVGPRFEATRRR